MKSLITLSISIFFIFSCGSPPNQIKKDYLPVHFSNDRFYLTPVTKSGDTLLFYTDTGGGANLFYEHALDKITEEVQWLSLGDDSAEVVPMPAFKKDATIPAPSPIGAFGNHLMVYDGNNSSHSGFLGRLWFANRTWEFNYLGKSLALVAEVNWPDRPSQHRVKLGFQTDSAGTPTTYFPRIAIEIDGDSIDVLYDTGATATLTENAAYKLNMKPGDEIGTSFIIESIFKKWQKEHPEWVVINSADETLGMPMIKVPKIKIAGHETGPVWFTMRPDRNFTEYMTQWMDKKVEGAIGGSALKYFNIIFDYPNQIAEFQKLN